MLNIPMDLRSKLKSQLLNEEEYRQFPYTDTTGHLSIGIGRNISQVGISMDEALVLLDDDIMRVEKDLWHYFAFYPNLDNVRKLVLIDMVFNVGIQSFLGFKNMIAAINVSDYHEAAKAMLESKWAIQVGSRAINLARIMESGEL